MNGLGKAISICESFADLMEAITGKKIFDINLLYIIDVDVKIEMSDIFEKCLQKDRNTLCNRFTFKIYLKEIFKRKY